MNYVNRLANVLEEDLSTWHKARLKFMARFVGSLLKLTTTNFAKLALALNPHAKEASNYRRIQRFMANFAFDFQAFGALLFELLPQQANLTVSMDRTNWQFGETDLNVLMIGICCNETCFPIVWTLLGKAGNSNTEERIALTRRFLRLVDPEQIRSFVADREFIGHEWLAYLKDEKVPFTIRIRKNMNVAGEGQAGEGQAGEGQAGEGQAAWRLFEDLKVGQWRIAPGRPQVMGHTLYVVGMKYLGRENTPEYLLLVTDGHPHWALSQYRKRWGIETLFGALKSRGFDLESTHMTDSKRLSKLIGLLALAFCWSHLVGQWRHRARSAHHEKTWSARKEPVSLRVGLSAASPAQLG